MPVLKVSRGRGRKAVLDVLALCDLIREWAPDICYFEQVHGMEGDGVSTAFNFGHITGAAEAAIKMSHARFVTVPPPKWKKRMGLIKKTKDDSRARAMELWPVNAPDFRRKMDNGRADAALIAEYGRLDSIDNGVFA